MKVCAIIPSRNHYRDVAAIVRRLRQEKLFVYIIDDGSDEPAGSALAALHDRENGVVALRLAENRGKGGAVVTAMKLAIEDGFSHALQVDADGQHDLAALPRFLELAARYPEAVICGKPLYDASVPLGRKIGRWITHVWVWIETLSFRIADSMCGFRLYPLAPCAQLLAEEKLGSRMEFDTDIIVRLFWRGVAPVTLGVRVTYPPHNISNFDLLKDNWRIAKMHTRLFFTMLYRLPRILAHRPPRIAQSQEWAKLSERGVYLGLKFCAVMCRMLGRGGRRMLLAPIVLYFYLTGSVQRRASRQFLTQVLQRPPSRMEGFRPFMNFGVRALDVFMAWTGKMPKGTMQPTDGEILRKVMADKRGGLMVVSHLGNAEVVRALVDKPLRERLTVLVHTRHALNYNRIVNEGADDSAKNILQVTEVGPETIIALKQRVEEGGWIVIAGDRTPVLSKGHNVSVPFFGKDAPFPEGPWVLAALLGCPVYLLFCLLEGGLYRLTLESFSEQILLPRASRARVLRECVARYAQRLEHYCSDAPFQWYNFYDFWCSR